MRSQGHHARGHGPPPHAPAHGYRQKHSNHNLEFDSGLGVYLVLGLPHHYFIDGIYYKMTDHGWYYSHDMDGGGWSDYRKDGLPGKLSKKYKYKQKSHSSKNKRGDKRKGKNKGKNKGKGKRHDDD